MFTLRITLRLVKINIYKVGSWLYRQAGEIHGVQPHAQFITALLMIILVEKKVKGCI